MILRTTLCLILLPALCACGRAPQPKSELGQEIYRQMAKYEAVVGPTPLNQELCNLVNESSLTTAASELPELDPMMSIITRRDPIFPEGTVAARFSRTVEVIFRTQHLEIFLNTKQNICEAAVGSVGNF